ncbi:MarR family transcriptional regulator [Bacillus sp. CMF21]|uniref:MarR family winged helix-turn-helix transcriptional regulator n=1 Tax=Metabacillus dongyingensis TaxID=2874282 RepID=UPI001CBBF554|nr:MarR family transcriptional regulator [Metabacillus dongyingensis]UAL50639.1 MarR family transcriptional regulator [Metabacillus dongyingensis]UOK56706.1 MarR family transcriptional regulator [Bacillus sp. OVS6]USK26906.1 MarR family transcriptional regulator [Bacillus sp. CMF21]
MHLSNSCNLDEKIVYRLYEINKLTMPKFERCTGISQSRLELLHELYEADEISQTALQKKVNIDNAAVTRHLKQLEEKGMVTRRKNPADNRVTFVKLTEEGRMKIVAYKEEKQRFISNVLKDFSEEERSSLLNMLSRIQGNVEKIQ